MEKIVLGGGCYWCLDAAFRMINGVSEVTSGFAGGELPNPTYEQVGKGHTGYAEVVEIQFDPLIISLDDILEIFFTIHDPTTKDRQGADVGTQYRSIILYSINQQKEVAESAISRLKGLFENPIVTELKPLDVFYPAEEHDQSFYLKNQFSGYCQVVINPKLAKLREKFNHRLK